MSSPDIQHGMSGPVDGPSTPPARIGTGRESADVGQERDHTPPLQAPAARLFRPDINWPRWSPKFMRHCQVLSRAGQLNVGKARTP